MKPLYQIINEHSLLLEYDNDTTWKQHGKKVMARATSDTGDSHPVLSRVKSASDENSARSVIQKHLEDTDPTPNKQYAQHVHRIYGGGGVNRLEDLHSRMKPALEKFHELKNKGVIPKEHRDIGRIKSLGELETLVDKHSDDKSGKEVSREHSDQMRKESTIETHSTFTKVIPHTEAASKHYGCGTKWCTAADKTNMFNHYNSRGPLHILIPHSPKHPGEKYQYHWYENDLMNERDEPVSRDSLPHEMRKHLDLYDQHVEHAKNNPEIAKNHLEPEVKNHYIQHHATADEVAHYRENGTGREQAAAWASKHTPVENVVDFLSNKTPKQYYNEHAPKHPDYGKKGKGTDVKDALEHDYYLVKDNAQTNPNLTNDHVSNILRSKKYEDVNILSNSSLKDDYLSSMHDEITKNSPENKRFAQSAIIGNPNHSENTATKLFDSADSVHNKFFIARRGNFSAKKLKELVSHKDADVAHGAIGNKNADSEVVRAGLDHPEHSVRMMSRMKIAGEDTKDFANNGSGYLRVMSDKERKQIEPFTDSNWPNHPKNPDRK